MFGGDEGCAAGEVVDAGYIGPIDHILVDLVSYEFDMPKEQVAVVSILNVLGQEVEKVFAGKAERGRTTVTWNASGRPTGVYFVRLETAGFVQTRKLILLK